MAYDYDLFVIGGGSGGVRAARRAASLGKKVGIAEQSRYGGTCVVRGCVPKKLYVYASTFPEAFEDAAGYGWSVGETSFDWPKLVAAKEAEITRLEGLYRKGLQGANAEVFDTRARLNGPHEVLLEQDNRVVTAERIIIAVGGTPNGFGSLPGAEHCIVSDDAFDLPELPKSIIINGGGYIALEFAGIFNGLGVDTTVVYRGEKVLRGFDEDLRDMLQESYAARGIRILTNTEFEKVEKLEDETRKVSLTSGEALTADAVFLAIGRVPLTANLGLEEAGVETAGNGSILVDEFSRTSVPSIWALGDVTNRVELTPVAIHEAMCFISTEYLGEPQKPDHDLIATAVFTHPEIGTVGLTEAEAANRYDKLNVFRAAFRPMKNILAGRDEKMLMKIIVDAESDRVLGCHIMGPDAGELAQTLGIAIKMGAKKADFDKTMAVHPTAAEELVTMYEPTYTVEKGVRSAG